MMDRYLACGRWVRVRHAVYRLSGTPPSWHQDLLAACLAAGPEAVASHRAAGRLWRLDGLEAAPVEIVLPGLGRHRLGDMTVPRTRSLDRADVKRVDAIPCTSATRTMVDLASALDGLALEVALDSALRQGVTSLAYLERRLVALGSSGRAGTAVLRDLLGDHRRGQRPAESRRELELARLLVAAGLPKPVRQYELRRAARVVARFDLAYPQARIGVEFVSYRHHFGASAWRRDVGRTNAAAADDWLVFNLTELDVQDGCRNAAHGIPQAYGRRTAA